MRTYLVTIIILHLVLFAGLHAKSEATNDLETLALNPNGGLSGFEKKEKEEDEEDEKDEKDEEDEEDEKDEEETQQDEGSGEDESVQQDESDENEESESEDEEEEEDESEDEGEDNEGTDDGSTGGTDDGSGSGNNPDTPVTGSGYTILAWNNLGMHCMDDDYEVFSILPPYNTVNAHLIRNGSIITDSTSYRLTYEAVRDPAGSINTTSVGKTNFWAKGHLMYGNGATVEDVGLEGKAMPGLQNQPQNFEWGGSQLLKWFEAAGIPITPVDDDGNTNSYPMMRVKAWDTAGNLLAQSDIVLPVSDEMDCRKCHASGAGSAARPAAGWVNNANDKHDFRLNILRLHDEKQLSNPTFVSALQTAGYHSSGLFATVQSGTPILCASCHASEALPGTGVSGVPALTQAMHASHADVVSPENGLVLNAASNRSACYQCHPGSSTQCLRGAMGGAVDQSNGQLSMQCQDCHRGMSVVGASSRTGWLDEPNCQSCHTGTAVSNNGNIRFTSVFESNGSVRQAVNQTFATNANTPIAGHSLYRFSKGHGGLQCSACHGSTHAIWPSVHTNDNILSEQIQGHEGVIAECSACHTDSVPRTTNGGPHGMHPIGQSWVSRHEDVSHRGCQDCHGSNGGGTVLSQAKADRTLSAEGKTITFWRGQTVGCYECHNGSGGEGRAPTAPSVASHTDLAVATGAGQGSVQVSVTPTTGTSIRIVKQPLYGTAAVQGSNVVYYRNTGFVGEDHFTFAASNGKRESNLGTVNVHAN